MMLSPRYRNDGLPLLDLNNLQQSMKRQVESKLANATYRQEHISCAICQQDNFETLSEKDRYGFSFRMVVCRDCGLVQANPRMDAAAYREFYKHEYRKLYTGESQPHDAFFNNQYNHRGRLIYQYLISEGALDKNKKLFVLEVGCGAGGILKLFADKGHRIKGIDLGETYVEYGRKQHQLDLSVCDLENCELDQQPDLIIYSHVLEHILNPARELKTVSRVLADDGHLYIEVPGIKNLMHSYEMDLLRYLQNAHVYNFSLRSLTNLLGQNGFNLFRGNEVINSVFTRSTHSRPNIEDDYHDVINHLRRVERWRKYSPIPPYKAKERVFSVFGKVTRKLGIYSSVRRLYDRLGRD